MHTIFVILNPISLFDPTADIYDYFRFCYSIWRYFFYFQVISVDITPDVQKQILSELQILYKVCIMSFYHSNKILPYLFFVCHQPCTLIKKNLNGQYCHNQQGMEFICEF